MSKSVVVGLCASFFAAFVIMCSASMLWQAQDSASDASDSVEALKSQVDELKGQVDDLSSQVEDLQSSANSYRR